MTKELKIDALRKMKAFVESEEFGGWINGLCLVGIRLYRVDEITESQLEYLDNTIVADKPDNTQAYYWEPGLKSPRIEWINKKLKELE